MTLVVSALLSVAAFGQRAEERIDIFFTPGKATVDLSLYSNEEVITNFTILLDQLQSDTLVTITKIMIEGYASPKGDKNSNIRFSKLRSDAISKYILSGRESLSPLVESVGRGIAWEQLRELVIAKNITNKDEIVDIIDNVEEETWVKTNPTDKHPTLVDSRNKHLMDVNGGVPYNHMDTTIFPILASHITLQYERREPPVVEVVPEPEPEPEPVVEPELEVVIEPVPEVEVVIPEPEPIIISEPEPEVVEPEPIVIPEPEPVVVVSEPEPIVENKVRDSKGILALKSNLLYDALTIANIEVEVPIGDRFSIAGEWIFPWWTLDSGTAKSLRTHIHMLNANLEYRVWLGDRSRRDVMTGWFAGVYGGWGKFSFEYEKDGIQGESFLTGGVTCGFAHTINRSGSLRLEHMLGFGYAEGEYIDFQSYYGQDGLWHSLFKDSHNYYWIGPTRLRVSLVWLFNK